MIKLFKTLKSTRGNSLAEFAVTAAMMATLATTAAPRFAGVGETGKQNQTKSNLEKLGKMAEQFYMNKLSPSSDANPAGEGQGRLPAQDRYDEKIGGYERLTDLEAVLDGTFDKWSDGEGSNWRSVFGLETSNQDYTSEYQFTDTDNDGTYGPSEWFSYLSESEGSIKSPYAQGHYIYTVIKGGQKEYRNPTTGLMELTDCNECGPILVIADAYNPTKYYLVKSFN